MPRLTRRIALCALLTFSACGSDTDPGGLPAPSIQIQAFAADLSSVTAGLDQAGDTLFGAATLSWTTAGAGSVALLADGVPVPLGACTAPGASDPCVRRGSHAVRVEATTEYTLRVGPEGLDCTIDGACVEATARVEARPPVTATLEAALREVILGSDVTVSYDIQGAETWAVGTLGVDDGRLVLRPCADADTPVPELGEARCRLAARGTSGTLVLPDLRASATVVAIGDNGAEDGRGALALGAIELRLAPAGAPELLAFDVSEDTVAPGSEVSLTWVASGAVSVIVGTEPAGLLADSAFAGCTAVDPRDGSGSCAIAIPRSTPVGRYTLAAAALGPRGGASALRTLTVDVGLAPELEAEVDPIAVPSEGGTVTLSWTAIGADVIGLQEVAPEPRTLIGDRSAGDRLACMGGLDPVLCEPAVDSVQITVAGTTTWRVTVANDFGEAHATLAVETADGPRITSLTLDGEPAAGLLLVDADSAELAWSATGAERVFVESAAPLLGDCDVPGMSWSTRANVLGGEHELRLDGLDVATCFRVRAVGALGREDVATFATVPPPLVVTAGVDDDTVQQGGKVVLSWQIANAEVVELEVAPPGALSDSALASCAEELGQTGVCELTAIAGDPDDELQLTLGVVAVGPTGARSETFAVSVTVGHPPSVNLDAAPPILARGGDVVSLSWVTDGADYVVIRSDELVVVDTREDIGDASCVGGLLEATCEAEADRYVVGHLVVPRTWTLTATNDFGVSSDIASVFGADGPRFTLVALEGSPVADGGRASLPAASGELVWETENTETVVVQRAPWTVLGCQASGLPWESVSDSPSIDDGLILSGLDVPTCVRLAAQAPGYPDALRTLLAEQRPGVDGFFATDDTVAPGDRIRLTWSAPGATRVSIGLVSPAQAGYVDTVQLAVCTLVDPATGDGACDVRVGVGTPPAVISFRLIASTAAGTTSIPNETSVTVGNPPVIDLSVTPEVIPSSSGSPVTVAWSAPSATAATLDAVTGEVASLVLSLPASTGPCSSEGCTPALGEVGIPRVSEPTTFRFSAENAFGVAISEAQVTIEAQPRITKLLLGSTDVRGSNVVVTSPTVNVVVTIVDALSGTIQRAEPVSGRCTGADIEWVVDPGLPPTLVVGVDQSVELRGLDGHDCFRVTALGESSSATASFGVVRRPEVVDVSASDDVGDLVEHVTRGGTFALGWETEFATSVSVAADPASALETSELGKCVRVDPGGEGSCVLRLRDDATADELTLTLIAHGPAGAASRPETLTLEVGDPPEILEFTTTVRDGVGISFVAGLSWVTTGAETLAIEAADDGIDIDTSGLSPIEDAVEVPVAGTTTFTLTVGNDFGETSSSRTVFVGASVDELIVNGIDALDGRVEVPTGDIFVGWAISGASTSWLGTRAAPVTGRCSALSSASFEVFATNEDTGLEELKEVTGNRCLRAAATGEGGASQVDALVVEVPAATAFAASPNSLELEDPESIRVTADLTGAATARVTAEYVRLDEVSGPEVLSSETVCVVVAPVIGDDGVTIDGTFRLACDHDFEGLRCLLGSCDIPDETDVIRYVLRMTDAEGDESVVVLPIEDSVSVIP
jgi:hypothetical protein